MDFRIFSNFVAFIFRLRCPCTKASLMPQSELISKLVSTLILIADLRAGKTLSPKRTYHSNKMYNGSIKMNLNVQTRSLYIIKLFCRQDSGTYIGEDATNVKIEVFSSKLPSRKVSKMLNGLGNDM